MGVGEKKNKGRKPEQAEILNASTQSQQTTLLSNFSNSVIQKNTSLKKWGNYLVNSEKQSFFFLSE